jgi:hypothetical protein
MQISETHGKLTQYSRIRVLDGALRIKQHRVEREFSRTGGND